jgi:hypothetical protein
MFRIKIGVIHIKKGVRQPEKIIPSNSWVTNMGAALAFIFLPSDNTFPVKTYTLGADFFFDNTVPVRSLWMPTPVYGATNRGIVVGTNNTPPTRDDYIMGTLIDHGVAAGQLEYTAFVIGPVQAVTGGYLYTIPRQFDNNSGGPITVEEMGAVVQARTSSGNQSMLILHDLLPGGELIADGDSLITNYHWEFLV